jgi:hypothetical protein
VLHVLARRLNVAASGAIAASVTLGAVLAVWLVSNFFA